MHELQNEFRGFIRTLLKMKSGTVRPTDFNQPSEGDSFVMIQLSEAKPVGMYSYYIDDDGKRRDYQYIEITFTFDFFGINSGFNASRLHLMMQTPFAEDEMQRIGMGYMSCSSAINLTALELEKIERYQVKLSANYIIENHDDDIQYDNFEVIKINLIAEP